MDYTIKFRYQETTAVFGNVREQDVGDEVGIWLAKFPLKTGESILIIPRDDEPLWPPETVKDGE